LPAGQPASSFTNYFEPADLPVVEQMFTLLSTMYLPADAAEAPQLTLSCANAPNADTPNPAEQCNDPNLLAFPDPPVTESLINTSSPPPASGLGLCPHFFDPGLGGTTVFSYPASYWCANTSNGVEYYETVGTALILALVQADAFGSAVGLPAHTPLPGTNSRITESHGACVYEAAWDTGVTPVQQARDLKEAGEGQEFLRVASAWSYAASATEWYFLTLCGWEGVDIPA
jgi:hypothetical protein